MDLTSTIDALLQPVGYSYSRSHNSCASRDITGGSVRILLHLLERITLMMWESGAGDDTITFTANLDDLDTIDGGRRNAGWNYSRIEGRQLKTCFKCGSAVGHQCAYWHFKNCYHRFCYRCC